jgi:hypothetical protein
MMKGSSWLIAEKCRLQREAASLVWGTNEAEIFGQARRFRVALTWALEIVTYGRSGIFGQGALVRAS